MKKWKVKIANPLTRSILEQVVEATNEYGALRACHALLASGPFSVDSIEEVRECTEKPAEEVEVELSTEEVEALIELVEEPEIESASETTEEPEKKTKKRPKKLRD